ncbi:MAG TPA: DedA family protein [Stellaceae bacterium]|jgi:membrane protein DedA with SNARE-associated domain|nr:DedA family protein [Stellaceae bacterium]
MESHGGWVDALSQFWALGSHFCASVTQFDIRNMVVRHGHWFYLITFLWTFVEGETFVIFAGTFAAQGLLDPLFLLLSAWLGSFSGDQLYFYIGRRFGGKLLHRYPRWRPGVDTALAFLRRYSTGFILSFRFTYGVRNFSSFAMGMSGLIWRRFLALNFVAAGLWATTFVGAGYLLGNVFGAALRRMADSFGLVMLGIFVLVTAVILTVHRIQRRRRMTLPRGAAQVIPPS